jgi:hypothetical protein
MMGPSLSESMVGATVGSKGTVFQQKTYMKRKTKGHRKGEKEQHLDQLEWNYNSDI